MEHRNDIIDDLIVKYMTGDITPDERRQLRDWASATPSRRRYVRQGMEVWFSATDERDLMRWDVQRAFDAFRLRVGLSDTQDDGLLEDALAIRHPLWPHVVRYAAAVAVLLVVAAGAYVVGHHQDGGEMPRQMATISVPTGSEASTTLPDGSRVTLSGGSTLTYGTDYGHMARQVELDGEATFAVRHDSLCPFSVTAGDMCVNDLGTTFTVTAYKEETVHQVSLVSGSAMVDNLLSRGLGVTLRPGQTARLDTRTGRLRVMATANIGQRRLADGTMLFENITLADIARVLERTYGCTIVIASPQLAHTKYYVAFDRHTLSLTEILDMLAQAKPFSYSRAGQTVTIR